MAKAPEPKPENQTPAASEGAATAPAPVVVGTESKPETPASPSGQYRVTHGDHTGVYAAASEGEAWAMFCDVHKLWPSPKSTLRKIEKL